ncbi:hypothetical protein [Terasakiella pusilla]|uniref:hypothetical protein n=1 Tax=Terasakiella pusilla TaxID=64973 RepID=UPI003AA9C756
MANTDVNRNQGCKNQPSQTRAVLLLITATGKHPRILLVNHGDINLSVEKDVTLIAVPVDTAVLTKESHELASQFL